MTLMRLDPLRDLERMTEQAFGPGRASRAMPMEAMGRTSHGAAALHGAGSGVVNGLLIGWLLVSCFPVPANLTLVVYCAGFGAVSGAIFGVVRV